MHLIRKRIFVGNLPSRLSRSDVEEKLREFGNVLSVELKQRTDNEGNILSSFAFVDIETDLEKLDSCFQRFETQLWCNHKIKLELAKESFLDRLKREQNAAKSQTISKSIGNNSSHITEQTNSFERIADCNNDKGSIPCSEKRHSLILKGSKSHLDMVEKVIKRNNRKTERTCMNSIQPDEQKIRGSDDSFEQRVEDNKEREDVQSLCDEESDKETCKRYGSLPMFSGTKNLKDLGDRINPPSRREKRNIRNLSCPAKSPNCRHDSFSSDKIATEIKNDNTIYSSPVEPPNVFEKNSGHSEERIRKKPENDRIAEEKRLNALDERNKALSLQKEAVKKALSSVDSNTTINKKIVFDLDEDDEEPANLQADKNFLHDSNAESRKHKLFEDSSDDEDLKDWKNEEFKIKPQFEGPKGQKLLQIQSRYGNDNRFNLDERFQESEDEMECFQEERDEEDFNAEKQHQLSILQEILGIDVSTRITKKDRVDNRNHIDMVRFDPSNPDHSKYIVKEDDVEAKKKVAEREVKGKKRKREVEEKGEEEEEEKPVPTSTERFYVVSDLLKESLKKRNEQNDTVRADGSCERRESAKSFSLLKTFGSAPSDNDEEEEIESYASHPIKKGLHDWDKNPFKYDSSDDEEDNIKKNDDLGETSLNNSANTSKLKNENEKSSTGLTEKFHFKDEDPRLQEGLAFFMVEKSFEEMQEGFQEKRADLKLIIKAKVRNNKRKKQPFRRKLGGLRRNQRNLSSKARN